MIIVRPVEITDTVLTSSDVVEAPPPPEFEIGTSYDIGDEVQVTTPGTHSVYVSLEDSNIGNQPELDDLITPVHWARVRATNRWAMFSDQISDQSTRADEINVTLTPAAIVNGISFFNVDASTIHIVMDDPVEGIVYDETIDMTDNAGVNDWYEWYFEPITRQDTAVRLDLPPFSDADIILTFEDTGATVGCGLVSIGSQRRLGRTNFGTGIGIVDYSRKERDTFGEPIVVTRNFSKRADYDVTVETGAVGTVQATLSDFRTTPLTWVGDGSFPSTVIYGYYRDYDVVLSNFSISRLTIQVEGLT